LPFARAAFFLPFAMRSRNAAFFAPLSFPIRLSPSPVE
jgi:hypothetical protein